MVSYGDLIAEATGENGLEDFGEDSFREGLERLVNSLREEANLNATGESVIYPRLVSHLRSRLEVEDWYRRHPEIDEVEITAPLFGLGLPRTGSTALSFLLAQDPDVRYLRQWESAQPCPPPSTVEGPDPRNSLPTEQTEQTEQVGSKQHVPSELNGPMECLDLMALDFKTQIYLAFAHIPSYTSWLTDTDLTSTYLYERRVLKLLAWGEPTRPWRLKSPAHMLWINHLVAAFPDARFVMTHRDPTDVLLSVCDVYADIAGNFTDDLDRHYIGSLNLDQWAIGMDRLTGFRDSYRQGRFYDIDFRAMQSDPIGEVCGLYRWLGAPVSQEFEDGMQRWWATNSAGREESRHSDPAVYGLNLDHVRERFADYAAQSRLWTAHGEPTPVEGR
jgi:Sulfotransferase family